MKNNNYAIHHRNNIKRIKILFGVEYHEYKFKSKINYRVRIIDKIYSLQCLKFKKMKIGKFGADITIK